MKLGHVMLVTVGAVLVLLPLLVHSVGVDMGDCACLCGLETSGGVVGPDGQSQSIASFASRVRGQKGDRGLTGKMGVQGPRGRPGIRGPRGPPGVSSGDGNNAALSSCYDLRSAGHLRNGIYKIKPSATSSTIQVYCDMETAGGGWTMVGSVHENNIEGKCTIGDNWSDDQGRGRSAGAAETTSWSNTRTFGSVEGATSDDYKNSAYFSLPASDVMVWHVPNDVAPAQWSNRAFLKYYTRTGFLTSLGGTLRDLYHKNYPMEVVTASSGVYEGVGSIIRRINASAADIRATIPDFHNYAYDGGSTNNAIGDGGSDMYDTGNRVSFRAGDGDWTQVVYEQTYKDMVVGYELSSVKGHPFLTLAFIGNNDGATENFDLRVQSGTGADGSGSSNSYDGDMTRGNFNLKYKTYNVYDANDPSITEVYFTIYNTEDWNSVVATNTDFFRTLQWSSGTDSLDNAIRLSGNPQNVLFGYTLFSKTNDRAPSNTEVRSALMIMLERVSHFTTIQGFNCSRLDESVVTPVVFQTGDASDVADSIPGLVRGDTEPGFLQLRAVNPDGVPFAMCPGVKTTSCRPSSVCIGTINTMSIDSSICGDFTGYAGKPGNRPTEASPAGAARSLRDQNSSILIFTRDSDSAADVDTPAAPAAKKPAVKKG